MPTYKLVTEWDLSGVEPINGGTFNLIYEKLDFFNKRHYHEYVPCSGPEHPEFMIRLSKWINNVGETEEAKKRLLFEFAPQLLFFGKQEFISLYQTAFHGPITKWIIDELNLYLNDPEIDSKIATELHHHTWYCPITDSMSISDFHHANKIGGVNLRPDFLSLSTFADKQKIITFMQNHKDITGVKKPLKRIVLLEDFVGSGAQSLEVISFAASLLCDIPILFIPLIICPKGAEIIKNNVTTFKNLSYEPIIELEKDLFINNENNFSGELEKSIRDLAKDTYAAVLGNNASDPRPYSPFGFRETGAMVVMYSNTPANTLPIIQHESNTWHALFPRSARIK